MKRGLFFIFLIIGSIGSILLLQIGFIFLIIGLLPSVMAYMVDDDPKKNLFKCVTACNCAGMLPTLASLINRDYPGAALQVTMSDPKVWFVVYLSAFAGWILKEICRWIAYFIIMTSNQARVMMLEQEQKSLVDEWGEDVMK